MDKFAATTALVVAIAISGCLKDGKSETAGFALSSQESATYDAFIGEEKIGTIELTLSWESEAVKIDGRIRPVDIGFGAGESSEFLAEFDPQSGMLRSITSPEDSRLIYNAFGIQRTMPVPDGVSLPPAFTAFNGPFWVTAARAVTPIGPQWALLATLPEMELPEVWGEAKLTGMREKNGWSLITVGPCQVNCPTVKGSTITTEMEGDWNGLFPKNMTSRADIRDATGFHMSRTAWSFAGTKVEGVGFSRPIGTPGSDFPRPCAQWFSCELESWPSRWSILEGWRALQGTAEWVGFNNTHPEWWLAIASLYSDNDSTLASQSWIFKVGLPDANAHTFILNRRIVGDQIQTPILLTSNGPSMVQVFAVSKNLHPGLLDLGSLTDSALNRIGVEPSGISGLSAFYFSPPRVPDERFQVVTVVSDDSYCGYANAVTGELIAVSACQQIPA